MTFEYNIEKEKNTFLSVEEEQKNKVLSVRKSFFNSLKDAWSRKPEEVDRLMKQEDCFYLPDYLRSKEEQEKLDVVIIENLNQGILAVSVTPVKENGQLSDIRWIYSIMQAGDWFRFGVLIQGPAKKVIQYAQNQNYMLSIEKIWDSKCDHQVRDSAGLLLEWRFVTPDFYDNFVCRERFLIIARHLHFRIGRIIQSTMDNDEDFVVDGGVKSFVNKDGLEIISLDNDLNLNLNLDDDFNIDNFGGDD